MRREEERGERRGEERGGRGERRGKRRGKRMKEKRNKVNCVRWCVHSSSVHVHCPSSPSHTLTQHT